MSLVDQTRKCCALEIHYKFKRVVFFENKKQQQGNITGIKVLHERTRRK